MEELIPLFFFLFIGLPWLVLHYVTKWKTSATITTDDERMFEELYDLAVKLDQRMDSIERIIAADGLDRPPAAETLKLAQRDLREDRADLDELLARSRASRPDPERINR